MVKVIYTSALIPNKFNERKRNYIESYDSLSLNFKKDDIHILECFSSEGGFLLTLGSPVHLSLTHDIGLKNKGVLELNGILNFIRTKEIETNYFLKITGRYKFIGEDFLKLLEKNLEYDFYGKLIDKNTQVFTGCFLIKKNVLLEFLEFQDFNYLEKKMINIEKALLDFLKIKNKKCFFVENLGLEAPIFGTGNIETHVL